MRGGICFDSHDGVERKRCIPATGKNSTGCAPSPLSFLAVTPAFPILCVSCASLRLSKLRLWGFNVLVLYRAEKESNIEPLQPLLRIPVEVGQ